MVTGLIDLCSINYTRGKTMHERFAKAEFSLGRVMGDKF